MLRKVMKMNEFTMEEYYNYLQVFKDAIGKLYKINPQKFKEVLEILLELI